LNDGRATPIVKCPSRSSQVGQQRWRMPVCSQQVRPRACRETARWPVAASPVVTRYFSYVGKAERQRPKHLPQTVHRPSGASCHLTGPTSHDSQKGSRCFPAIFPPVYSHIPGSAALKDWIRYNEFCFTVVVHSPKIWAIRWPNKIFLYSASLHVPCPYSIII